MSIHIFKTLPREDKRQTDDGKRAVCTRCGVLRAPRLGGGYVYSATGWGRSDWVRQRPRCTAADWEREG